MLRSFLPLCFLFAIVSCNNSGADQPSSLVTTASPTSLATATTETASAAPTIGYVGCSLTLGAVDGYATLGGTKFWPDADTAGSYPGGSVSAWYGNLVDPASPNNRWNTFSSLLTKYVHTNTIWWHLCPPGSAGDTLPTYEETLAVLNQIKQETDAEIYASITPQMPLANTNDYDTLNSYLTTMTSQGLVKQGPVLTALTQEQLGTDGHPNEAGKAVWGQDLLGFFGQ